MILAGEVPVDRPFGDAGALGDLRGGGGAEAADRKKLQGRAEQALTGLFAIATSN
jgi:hypothetical protein